MYGFEQKRHSFLCCPYFSANGYIPSIGIQSSRKTTFSAICSITGVRLSGLFSLHGFVYKKRRIAASHAVLRSSLPTFEHSVIIRNVPKISSSYKLICHNSLNYSVTYSVICSVSCFQIHCWKKSYSCSDWNYSDLNYYIHFVMLCSVPYFVPEYYSCLP